MKDALRFKRFKGRCKVWYRYWRMGNYLVWKQNREEWLNRGCEYCGGKPICQGCGRCYDRNCNAGCIACNYPKETETCKCCGQEIK